MYTDKKKFYGYLEFDRTNEIKHKIYINDVQI